MYRASNPSLSHVKQFHFLWVSRVRRQRYIWISMRQYSMTDNWQLCELDKVHKTISSLNCLFKLQSKCFQSKKTMWWHNSRVLCKISLIGIDFVQNIRNRFFFLLSPLTLNTRYRHEPLCTQLKISSENEWNAKSSLFKAMHDIYQLQYTLTKYRPLTMMDTPHKIWVDLA